MYRRPPWEGASRSVHRLHRLCEKRVRKHTYGRVSPNQNFLDVGSVGKGTGGSWSPASRTPFSRLPSFFVPLSPDSRPLLCFSRYHVNYVVWNPILIGSSIGLVQNKKLCCKSNHFALPNAIIEAAFLRHKYTPRNKIFSVLWTTVVRSELPGRSSMDEFFPTTPRPIKMVFDDILPDSLCCSYGEFRQLARQTRQWRDWHSRHTCTCVMPTHSCPMM